MAYKYHCLNPIAACGLDNFTDAYAKTEDVNEADAILVRSAVMHDMDLPANLLAVARAGAGVNNIPLDKCAEKGIVVFNTPGANANAVKELVFAGMLLAARDIVGGIEWAKSDAADENIAKTAEKEKKKFAGTEIAGDRVCFRMRKIGKCDRVRTEGVRVGDGRKDAAQILQRERRLRADGPQPVPVTVHRDGRFALLQACQYHRDTRVIRAVISHAVVNDAVLFGEFAAVEKYVPVVRGHLIEEAHASTGSAAVSSGMIPSSA